LIFGSRLWANHALVIDFVASLVEVIDFVASLVEVIDFVASLVEELVRFLA
jgi:hypothetical protein